MLDPQAVLAAYARLKNQTQVAREFGTHQATISHILRRHGVRVGRGNNQARHSESRILTLWDRFRNQHAVARELGIRPSAVSKVLRRLGIHVGKGRREPIHKLPMGKVAARYLAGETCRQLGKAFGVDSEVIRRRLRSEGVSRRGRGAKGAKNSQWKGGKSPTMHYHRRQAYEVVAICLGKPLPRAWVVHHADEDPTNNDPANLLLFRSKREHTAFHQRLLRIQSTEPQADATLLALESGAVRLPPPPAPIAFELDKDPPDLFETLRKQEPAPQA